MECNQDKTKQCDNIDFHKCKSCIAPMWCLCERKEKQEETKELWNKKV